MQIYLVGGAVRDRLLGIQGYDRDWVVVGSTVQEMLDKGYSQVGHDFPVFLHPLTHEEYALARTERKNGHGYLGFNCDFNPEITLEEDLKRRDLTINAIAMDKDGYYIDPYNGIADLKNRVLRHVSLAFVEDPLRVLRVARFAARFANLGFTIAKETLQLMREIARSGELSNLTPERVWLELQKSLNTQDPQVFIHVLRKTDALKHVLPEVDKLYGVPGPKRWHPEIDSGVHTEMTLGRISLETENPVIRFAMLCHDLGKALTPVTEWPHHHKHNKLGVQPLQDMCTRLHVPNEYAEFAYIVVLYHSDMHHIYRNGPESIVNLLEKLDAFRKPERIKPWVMCCKCDFLGRKGFENRAFPRADYFLGIFSLCCTVTAKEFVEKGFKGKQISEEIHKHRVRLVDDYLKIIPISERNDSANELPPAELYPQLY